MSSHASSLDSVLQESWDMMRPRALLVSSRLMSILDLGMLPGPINPLALGMPFGTHPMIWDGPVPAESQRVEAAKPKATAPTVEVIQEATTPLSCAAV